MEISFEDNSSSNPVFNKKVCRVCLKDSIRLKNLYIKKNLDVLEKLRSFIEIEDQTTTELPEWICLNCQNSLNSAFEFKTLCIQNDTQIRSMLNASKETKFFEIKDEPKDDEKFNEILLDFAETKIEEFNLNQIEFDALSDDPEVKEDNLKSFSESSSESDTNETNSEECSENENTKSSLSNDAAGFQCDLCKKKFTAKSYLRRHVTIVHSKTITYPCEFCKKEFRYPKALHSHLENVHKSTKVILPKKRGRKPKKTYKCEECSMEFTDNTQLKNHQHIHMPKIYKCDVCSKMFKTTSILKIHKIKHLTFEERNKLDSIKKYLCPICGKVLYSSSNRDAHVRGHSDDKPFVCAICDKGFKQKYLLGVHMSKHSDERPFKCEICGLCFKNQTQFQSHQLTHKLKDMEKQFECKICSVKFRYKLNLTHHTKNIHLGIRNYKCDMCDEAFYTSNLMRQHKAKKHQNDDEGGG